MPSVRRLPCTLRLFMCNHRASSPPSQVLVETPDKPDKTSCTKSRQGKGPTPPVFHFQPRLRVHNEKRSNHKRASLGTLQRAVVLCIGFRTRRVLQRALRYAPSLSLLHKGGFQDWKFTTRASCSDESLLSFLHPEVPKHYCTAVPSLRLYFGYRPRLDFFS